MTSRRLLQMRLLSPFLFVFPLSVYSEVAYKIAPLPSPSQSRWTKAEAVGGNGWAAGEAYLGDFATSNGVYQPLEWHNGTLIPLSLPGPGISAEVRGVNSNGTVVGAIWSGVAGPVTPVIWTNGIIQNLPTMGLAGGVAFSINNLGVAVGSAIPSESAPKLVTGVGADQAVRWDSGQASVVAAFSNASNDSIAINNYNQILLNTGDGDYTQTYIQSNGVLFSVPGITGNITAGAALNDAGDVVGSSLANDGTPHAFLWHDNVTSDLGRASGELLAAATAINSSGLIGGYGVTSNGALEGLLWDSGQLIKLADVITNNDGWSSETIAGIADDGTIVGTGDYNGIEQAFILTPDVNSNVSLAPEPTTLSIVALAAIPLLRRRR